MAVSNEANILFNAKMGRGFAELLEEMNRLQKVMRAMERGGERGQKAFDEKLPAAVAKYDKELRSALASMKALNLESERMRLSKKLGREVHPAEVSKLAKEEAKGIRLIKQQEEQAAKTSSKIQQEKTRESEREGRSRIKASRRETEAIQKLDKENEVSRQASRIRYEQAQARLADKVIKFETGITAAVERSARAEERRLRALQGEVRASMESGGVPLSSLESLPGGAVPFLGPNAVANLKKVEGQAKSAARAVGEIGRQGKFSTRVLEAFVLYRGFVMLQQGAMSATRSMIDLEKQVALVQTQLSGGVGRAVITDRIMDVANTTGLAFADVAKAEYSVVSANIALGDSWRVLDLSAKAAVAGGLADVQTAFNAALAQVNAFGLGVEEFGRVYDLQFNLVKRGIFTYEQLANIVGEVSLAFANAGQDIETANSAIAAISQIFTGPQITEGATALKRLANQIAQTPEAFEKMGIAVADSDGNYRNFILILEDLKAALAGMSQTESQKVLHEMFPDERELRGARGALQTLDAMKDIYIEQQLALGDMEDKFKDVADTMDTRLGQLRNNMQEGFVTATDIFGGLLKAMNEMEKVLPGLTASMVSFGAAAAMVGIVGTYATGPSAANPAVSRIGAFGKTLMNPMVGGGSKLSLASRPLAMAGFMAAGGIGMGMGAAAKEGPSYGGIGGSIAMGAAFGSPGGIAGAGIGAALGAATYFFSAIQAESQEKARLAARSFTDAIREELQKNAGDIAKALPGVTQASDPSGEKGFAGLQAAVQRGFSRSIVDITTKQGKADALAAMGRGDLVYGASKNRGVNSTEEYTVGSEAISPSYLDSASTNRRFVEIQSKNAGIDAAVRAAEEARAKFTPNIRAQMSLLAGKDLTSDDALSQYIDTAIQSAVQDSFPGENNTQSAAAGLAMKLEQQINSKAISREMATELVQQFGRIGLTAQPEYNANAPYAPGMEPKSVADWLKISPSDAAKIMAPAKTALGDLAAIIEKMGPNWQLASDVFAELGDEGKKLAAVFDRVAAIADGFGKLKSLSELIIPGTPNAPLAPGRLDFRMYKEPDRNVMTESGINVDNVASIMQGELNRTLDRIQAMSGMGRDAAMAEYLMRGPAAAEVKPFEIPGATSLGEQLEAAAEYVASGFIPSLGFTADQLMGFSREFNDINRAIAKMNLLGEFQRLGVTLFGMPEDYMRGAMTTLLGSMRVGAEDLRSLFQDPTRLAELLASSFEFGDIQVDQSTNNNYVIRISGDIDSNPHNLAKIAEGILQQINIKSREAKRR